LATLIPYACPCPYATDHRSHLYQRVAAFSNPCDLCGEAGLGWPFCGGRWHGRGDRRRLTPDELRTPAERFDGGDVSSRGPLPRPSLRMRVLRDRGVLFVW